MSVKINEIIFSFNDRHLLGNCLNSLKNQSFRDFEIIIADNRSTDNSVNIIKKHYSKITLIQLDKNYGFSKVNNIGIKHAKGKYIMLLNNDIEVDVNWLSTLEKAFGKTQI